MDKVEKFMTIGERLGYKGENLQTHVNKEVEQLDKKRQQEAELKEHANEHDHK